MPLLETLKLIKGVVSEKDNLLPTLTHICIYNGRVQGGNGRVAIDAACPELDFNVVVPADRFVRAIDSCKHDPVLTVDRDRLLVRDKRLRVSLSMLPFDSYARAEPPHGTHIICDKPLLPAFRRLAPFISTDASRPWACSLLAHGAYLYATNNVVLARVPFRWAGDDLAFPAAAVNEMLRIGREPAALYLNAHAVYAEYVEGSWIKMQRLQAEWPIETLERLIDSIAEDLPALPIGLRADVEMLQPFFPDEHMPVVLTGNDGVSTQSGVHHANVSVGALPSSVFRVEPLLLVLACATHADISRTPCPWRGVDIEGLLSTVRL